MRSAKSGAYDIRVAVPSRGSLRAQVGNLSSGMLETLPLGAAGRQLTLSFDLPGFFVTFSDAIYGRPVDPRYWLSFNGAIRVMVAVPTDPRTPLGVKVQFHTLDTAAGPANVWAFAIGARDFLRAWIAGHPPAPAPTDSITGISVPEVKTLFTELSSGFATAVDIGFRKLDVNIVPTSTGDNAVQFDLVHPFDPAPAIRDALIDVGPSFFFPRIGTSAPRVHGGGSLGVSGSSFTAPQSTRLMVRWEARVKGPNDPPNLDDGTTFRVAQSEVQWGPATGGSSPPQPRTETITRAGRYDGLNQFQATNLAPTTVYAFRARDFSVAGMIATDWSNWLFLRTSANDQIELQLPDLNVSLGSARLLPDSTFTTTITIPPNVPPGSHLLVALESGQRMAQTVITVLAQGATLPPVLETMNRDTNLPFSYPPLLIGAAEVRLRGSSFAPGPVDLFVDSTAAQRLGSATADASGTFGASITWPPSITGPHDILAQQGLLEARTPVRGQQPPR